MLPFCQCCVKTRKKCCWPKVGGAVAPPAPPGITPLSVLPSPGGPLSRHMPSSSIASANKEVKSVLECRSHKPRSQTSSLLSVDKKREVSKLNVGVVLIIAIREISNHGNEFDVNSRNIRPSKITRYTVFQLYQLLIIFISRNHSIPSQLVLS